MENSIFSDRINDVPRSFIRDILKVAVDESIISFAGGLPNRDLFPVEEIKTAAVNVLEKNGKGSLQYAASEGFYPLRQYIKDWYKRKKNLDIPVKNILITSGSQQGLDLLGKVLLNDNEELVIEAPGYLGAIQAFSMYRPAFIPVSLQNDGINISEFEAVMKKRNPKLIYMVPNFQNPSGITYSQEKRKEITEIVRKNNAIIVEDDPYGELRFEGDPLTGFGNLLPEQSVLLGTFSKTVAPALRIGWIVAPDYIMDKLIVAKQAADLHTNSFAQMILHEYLSLYNPENHIRKIREVYGKQSKAMQDSIKKYFPDSVKVTQPKGGMFLWATLPENISSMKLFEEAIKEKVAFVPGHPFYINKTESNDMRLNFSCVDEATINVGIQKLANSINKILKK